MSRTIVAANRGPLRNRAGEWVRASDGLVTALDPILRERGGVWVSSDALPPGDDLSNALGYELAAVPLEPALEDDYYLAFSNAVLWPILHGFPATIRIGAAPFEAYLEVNRRFADRIVERAAGDGGPIWIHDYHLMLAPALVRRQLPDARIGWFCHVPWPSEDHFRILPFADTLVRQLLAADHLAFHTARYARSFLECARRLPDVRVDPSTRRVTLGTHTCEVLVAPIGIATDEVETLARRPDVRRIADELRAEVGERRIILGVDRLDYSKGIPERLLAFDRLLRTHPALREECVLVQIMVPSRTAVDAYADLKMEIDGLIGQITGRHARTGSTPVHYLYRSVPAERLFAHYLAADVALVTPLRDGMNLVAQEYVMARTDELGALVLSELAGAADHLSDALLVNPYDVEATAEALHAALHLSPSEQQRRMRCMREHVRRLDVHGWARGLLEQLAPPETPAGGHLRAPAS